MRAIDYLKLAIEQKMFYKKNWFIKVFSVTRPSAIDEGNLVYADLHRDEFGLLYVNEDNQLVKITDSKPNKPLFTFMDRITVDSSWASNASGSIDTTIGNLLVNHVAIISTMGNKLPFITGRFNIGEVESQIAAKLASNVPLEERNDTSIYVDEMLKFQTAIAFLEGLSQLCTIAATRKNISPPTGIKEFKAKLNEKYKGKLHDPVEVANYEAELLAFDEEFLKDDPSNGLFMGARVKGTARKKLFLAVGVEQGFNERGDVLAITQSLGEGVDTDPEKYAATMNGMRYASFSRGSETIQGGVAAKYLLRAANNYRIVNEDCGTKLGIRRRYTEQQANKLAGRYILEGTKTVHMEDITVATNYVNKDLVVRSPAFCKTEGEMICTYCAGDRLSQYPTGLAIPLTNVSSGLIIISLKKMHSNTLSTAKLDLNKIIS